MKALRALRKRDILRSIRDSQETLYAQNQAFAVLAQGLFILNKPMPPEKRSLRTMSSLFSLDTNSNYQIN